MTGAPDLLDRLRRDVERSLLRTRNGLKLVAGIGRPELGASPKDTVWQRGKVQVWRYRSEGPRLQPPLLLVHSLVSRSYVLDLRPGNSVVEALVNRGFDVFLIDWGAPDELEAANTLQTYADDLIPSAIEAVREVTGASEVLLLGYCFGAVLSLLHLAGDPGTPVRAFLGAATPVDGAFLSKMTGPVQAGRLEAEDLIDETGNVPASVIANGFRVLQPTADLNTYADLWLNLWQDDYVEAHQAMTRWGNDHIPFPGAAFGQMIQVMVRENQLASGTVTLDGRPRHLADIRCPALSVVGEKDHIVPPASSEPLTRVVGPNGAEEARFPAGHVGLFVGRSAQRRTVPAMADWLAQWTR